MTAASFSKDEIALSEIFLFFARQIRTIVLVFVVIFSIGLGYAITRPTVYISVAKVTIGDSLNVDSSESNQLESPETIIYKYSQVATIKPITKTNIVEVSVVAASREDSVKKLSFVVNELVTTQNHIYQEQESKFIKYLGLLEVAGAKEMQILSLLQNASHSSMTHSSEITTAELSYSGKMYKILLGTTLIAFLAALVIGAIKEWIGRGREVV
ncbi:hypothetical protein LOY67_03655 [Pseudomonas sp. B21-056]|jgi:uncharacterized protein involved in exopolysaccharide biosynthesis|uniref:hypothetical protein n=1 Tax=Pseudomonas sp. B21-056 TaxID=2895495 RepID=UPI00222EF239|nr:hypothetical protein [Pseudomonas sp. B21-056]UZE24520.1 hypothetical protein LOY67_03655 [Pseudomonas sp. B21-056]